jgi:hypothetical protein
METPDQPRRLRSLLVVIVGIAAVAVVWAAVAHATGSGSGSGSVSSSDGSTPVATYDAAAEPQFTAGGPGSDCPDHDGGGSTAPSTPATPSTPTTTDGSTSASL